MNERILTVDDRILEARSIFQTKFDHIQNQLNIFDELIEEDRAFKVELDKIREDELHILSEEVDQFFTQEFKEREQQEKRLSQLIDEKFVVLQEAIEKESKIRNESNLDLEDALQSDVPGLQESVSKLSTVRMKDDKQLKTDALEMSTSVIERISEEKKER